MANSEHLAKIREGVEAWNKWRGANPLIVPDLSGVDLTGIELTDAKLAGANLSDAALDQARLRNVDLIGANLEGASLVDTNLRWANLTAANLTGTMLVEANFANANLREADLTRAILADTIFAGTELLGAKSLESCHFVGPSSIDLETLQRSGTLPLAFLRGCDLPDTLIDDLPSLLKKPIQFNSCFISYSDKDQDFVNLLYANLQENGVRCYYAREDMKGGQKSQLQINDAIRKHDRLLLVISEHRVITESGVWRV